jgi:hypothetical protein
VNLEYSNNLIILHVSKGLGEKNSAEQLLHAEMPSDKERTTFFAKLRQLTIPSNSTEDAQPKLK